MQIWFVVAQSTDVFAYPHAALPPAAMHEPVAAYVFATVPEQSGGGGVIIVEQSTVVAAECVQKLCGVGQYFAIVERTLPLHDVMS